MPEVSAEQLAVNTLKSLAMDAVQGPDGLSIGIDHFGASATAEVLAEQFGFTAEAIARRVKTFLNR